MLAEPGVCACAFVCVCSAGMISTHRAWGIDDYVDKGQAIDALTMKTSQGAHVVSRLIGDASDGGEGTLSRVCLTSFSVP